ncbi:methylated-DNA--[protein]-cysteine S-methyltransferase [Gammaproteobacteria bacterium]|nr:methylated-DNA--[protein]-cysteine S-methyltransferase [Gammaproteobacteria bacterium]
MENNVDLAHHQHYQRIEMAILYLAENHTRQPSLAELAKHVGLSESHFQRTFTQWVGISPKRFLQFLSKEYIKTLLDEQHSCLDAGYQAGLSSGSRIHELFISTEAITPAQYKAMGKNLTIYYGFHHSPFGEYLLAVTNKGICHLNFVHHNKSDLEKEFKAEWALATIEQNTEQTQAVHQQLFSNSATDDNSVKLFLKGTNFQIQVWQALLQIPFGAVSHYQGLARLIDKPTASRAAASAIARNKIGYLIPCHRVVRKVGESGEYRWGSKRKKIMLAYEAAMLTSQNNNNNNNE